jgi:hypothetical protein
MIKLKKTKTKIYEPKTQTEEEIQSPTEDILTPAELERLKNKVITDLFEFYS